MRARDRRQALVVGAAEELRDGDAEQLALQIPERDVDRREREGRDAAAVAVPPGPPPAAPPDVDVVERVAPDDELAPRCPSIIASVARQTSGHDVTASPQPTVPSSASIRQSVRCRIAPLSFGSGYRTEIGVTERTAVTRAPPRSRARGRAPGSRRRAGRARARCGASAPEAIQRAPASNAEPGVEAEHAVRAAHRVVARLDDLAGRPGEPPRLADRRERERRRRPLLEPERERGARRRGRPGSGRSARPRPGARGSAQAGSPSPPAASSIRPVSRSGV